MAVIKVTEVHYGVTVRGYAQDYMTSLKLEATVGQFRKAPDRYYQEHEIRAFAKESAMEALESGLARLVPNTEVTS